ncbi:MAG TPA: hypothetical protein VGJ39_06910 [Vicinamibacterales bacterium]
MEVFAKPGTNFKASIARDRNVPRVEKAMDVGPKQETIPDVVWTLGDKGLNVRGFEDG